jgi:hypothetical protein
MTSRKVVEDVPESTSAKDITELRERVVRLEVQVAEITKRVESLINYNHQLFDYLNRTAR